MGLKEREDITLTDKNIRWSDEYLNLIKSDKSSGVNKNINKKFSRSIVITGASVTGKTTLFRCLVAYFGLNPIPVNTTRKLRGDEVKDVDGVYISEEEFKNRFSRGEYIQETLESAYFSGAYYGCPRKWIESTESGENNCFICPTVRIAKIIKEKLGDRIMWVHMVANHDVRKSRLMRRDPDMTKENFEQRIKRGDAQVDISGHDLIIDTSYLSASDIFFCAMNNL